jgi:hypothetical protein
MGFRVMLGAASSLVMDLVSPSSMRRYTPGMVYRPVIPGTWVNVKTSILRSPQLGLSGPTSQRGYARNYARVCRRIRQGLLGTVLVV